MAPPITSSNIDLELMGSCGIHPWAILQETLNILIYNISLQITYSKSPTSSLGGLLLTWLTFNHSMDK